MSRRGDALLERDDDMHHFLWGHEGGKDTAEQGYGTRVNPIGDIVLEGTKEPINYGI